MALLKKYNEEDFRNKVRSSNHAIHEKYDSLPSDEYYDNITGNVKTFSTPEQNINTRIGVAQAGNVEINGEGLIDYSISNGTQDRRNLFPITEKSNDGGLLNITPDLIKFQIEVINSTNPNIGDILAFRAYLDSLSDDYTGGYNSYKYNGRAEKFYTYNEFDRNISFNFKIAAQTLQEMKPIYQKLNYLVAQTAPEYSTNGRMRGKFSRLTIGDWISNVPGFFESVGLSWNKNYPWEIDLNNDTDQVPHVLDVSCKFKPIHDFAPQNSKDTPFILPNS
tara:strand:- start:2681 stop:3514 length:834 start_codon:yes stop_codon:yes gene_type:complete